jgi:hypothetical protein
MKNIEDGRSIHSIYFPNGDCVIAGNNETLEIQNDYHGDYCIDWAILTRNGDEIARYNCRFIETIRWAD